MVRKILEEKPIPLGQVYEYLQKREESGINYVQRVTAQHAEKLSRNAAYSEEILEALQSEFNLSRLLAVQLVNINPSTPVDVKAITGEKLTDKQIDKLLERYSEFVLKTSKIKATSDEKEDEISELKEGFDDL